MLLLFAADAAVRSVGCAFSLTVFLKDLWDSLGFS